MTDARRVHGKPHLRCALLAAATPWDTPRFLRTPASVSIFSTQLLFDFRFSSSKFCTQSSTVLIAKNSRETWLNEGGNYFVLCLPELWTVRRLEVVNIQIFLSLFLFKGSRQIPLNFFFKYERITGGVTA